MTAAVEYDVFGWPDEPRLPAFSQPIETTDATNELLVSSPVDRSLSTDASTSFSAHVAALESSFGEAAAELRRYSKYTVGWDGYRAPPFGDYVLGFARSVLAFSHLKLLADAQVPELVTTGPASDGSLDVELRNQNKRLFITIYPDQPRLRISAILGQTTLEEVRPFESMVMATWLDWLFNSQGVPTAMDQDPTHS